MYSRLEPDWLRDILVLLPNLQIFNVSNFGFFDHKALASLKKGVVEPSDGNKFGLRYMDASYCLNTTPVSLVMALKFLPNLVYLDLSGTSGVNYPTTLTQIASSTMLPHLQILKLQNCKLEDHHIELLATGLGTRVWSLDLRKNFLTDKTAAMLLDYCFLPPEYSRTSSYGNGLGSDEDDEDEEYDQPPPDFTGQPNVAYRLHFKDDQQKEIVSRLAELSQIGHQSTIDDNPRTGLTHLYIADNTLSMSGASNLLKPTRLKALDCGSLRSLNNTAQEIQDLVQTLSQHANRRLHRLRIDHRIVTGSVPEKLQGGGNKNATTTSKSSKSASAAEEPTLSPAEDSSEQSPLLTPSSLPRLQTLTLTSLPRVTHNYFIPYSLKLLLRQLAEQESEEHRITSEAISFLDSQSDILYKRIGRMQLARSSKGLQTLVLELDDSIIEEQEGWETMNGGKSVSDRKRKDGARSSFSFTGSADSEAFASASKDDFSFFSSDYNSDLTAQKGEEGEDWIEEPLSPTTSLPVSEAKPSELDVVFILSSYRKERRTAYEAAVKAGTANPGTAGHWGGVVSIVRKISDTCEEGRATASGFRGKGRA
jgi:hypothetical protein